MENRREKVSLYGLRNSKPSLLTTALRGVFDPGKIFLLRYPCHANLLANLLRVFLVNSNKIFPMTIGMPMKSGWSKRGRRVRFVLQRCRPPRRRWWTRWMRSTRANGPDTICCTYRHKILTCCGKISLTSSRTRFLYHSTHIKANSRRWGYVPCSSR